MIFDRFLSQFAPYTCLGCGTEGRLVCDRCQPQLIPAVSQCFRCQQPTADYRTCSSCLEHTPLGRVVAASRYSGLAKELVRQLKFHSARTAATEMARLLAASYSFEADTLLVPVPTATSRVRQRSYDQAELFARALSRQTKLPYASPLRRMGQAHQVGAGRRERFAQLEAAYRLVRPTAVVNRHIILVDDVSTTGATLEAAAKVMSQAGAARVSAAVFAQA